MAFRKWTIRMLTAITIGSTHILIRTTDGDIVYKIGMSTEYEHVDLQ